MGTLFALAFQSGYLAINSLLFISSTSKKAWVALLALIGCFLAAFSGVIGAVGLGSALVDLPVKGSFFVELGIGLCFFLGLACFMGPWLSGMAVMSDRPKDVKALTMVGMIAMGVILVIHLFIVFLR